jgi:pullulanase
VNYASCHDNLSLFDKLALSNPNDSVEDRIKMNNLAAAIYMTSQGIPFMQAGEEMLRSKPLGDGTYDHNSYASPDSVNSIKWDNLNEQAYADTLAYYQGLIAFRKAHPALRMTDAQSVAAAITAVKGLDANVNAFQILGVEAGDSANGIFVIFNPNKTATTVQLPAGKWGVCINGEQAGTEVLTTAEGSVTVDAISAMVLVQNETAVETPETPAEEEPTNIVPVIMCGIAAVIAAGAALFAAIKFKKKK